MSKLVLGQTGTTDAVAGGSRGLGQVQETVRGDIERGDCVQLGATLSRDIGRPIVDLNFGPQKRYPLIRIGREEEKDVKAFTEAVQVLVPMGLKVGQKQARQIVGIEEPEADEELLVSPAPPPSPEPPGNGGGTPSPGPRADAPGDGSADDDTTDDDEATVAAARQSGQAVTHDWADTTAEAMIAEDGWVPVIDQDTRDALAKCKTREEFETVLASAFDRIGLDKLAEKIAEARFAARGAAITNE
jgi:phage gp29-like protein